MQSIQWTMMAAFVAAALFSLWKVYAFVPKQPLADDDTTPAATEELMGLMVRCIVEAGDAGEVPDDRRLYETMIRHERFDGERFWRFNQNRLNRLLEGYFLRNPPAASIRDIYAREK